MSKNKQIDEMSGDLLVCHTELKSGGEIYTDYDTTAEKMFAKGYSKRIVGKWQKADHKGVSIKGYMVCSVCNVMIPNCDDKTRYCLPRLDYCPRCGSKMKGGAE